MNFDEFLTQYKAQTGKQNNPFFYKTDQLARDLGFSGAAMSPDGTFSTVQNEALGEQQVANSGLSPEFETFLRQYDYAPAMDGKNGAMDMFKNGQQVQDNRRTSDHTGSMMKFMGTAMPLLVAGGFGAGALGALSGGGGAAAGAGDAWGATLNNSLSNFGLANTGAAAAEGGIGAATAVDALPALTQGGFNSAAFGATGDLMGQAMIPGALSAFGGGLTQGAVNSAALGPTGSLPGLSAGGIPWGQVGKTAGGQLLSAGTQMYGANQAAGAMRDATNQANQLNAPAVAARNSALEQMQALLKDPSTLTSQPGYQFGLNEGTKSLNSGAAARGMTYSGAQGKALQRYGQDYAGMKLDQSFNRLATLASGGQSGTSQTVDNITNQGNANAMPWVVGANAVADGINGLTAYGARKNWWGG